MSTHKALPPSMQALAADIDWDAIDPASAASLRMAIDMGIHPDEIRAALGGDEGARKAAAAADVATRATDAMMLTVAIGEAIEDPTRPETEEEARMWDELAELAALNAAAADEEHGEGTETSTRPDDEGMEEHQHTMEDTWGGGAENSEWVLERIIRRRKVRDAHGRHVSADYTEDEVGWEYQCVWKGYPDATWERRGFLRDMGFGREVERFDTARAPAKPTSTLRRMPQKPSRSALGLCRTNRRATKTVAVALRDVVAEVCARITGHKMVHLEYLMRRLSDCATGSLENAVQAVLIQLLTTAFSANLDVSSITFITPQSLAAHVEFMKQNYPAAPLQVVYHGTQSDSVKPISATGLVIPGQGNNLPVRNGQVLGLGVYSATELLTPAYYAKQGDYFMCSSYQPVTGNVVFSGTIRVFFDVNFVTPFMHFRASNFVNECREPRVKFENGVLTALTAPVIHFVD